MKIAGGLTIILVLGALETLEALTTPFGKEDGGVGVAYKKEKGLTLKQKDNKITESHQHSEAASNSHVIGSDGSVTDSEHNKSHQEDKKDETSNTRELSLGGKDGGLSYEQTKETKGTSQQIDEEKSRKSKKQEESEDGYYHNRESQNEEQSKKVKQESYAKKESKGFKLGKDGFKKEKTESSENLKKSETKERSSRNQELEEERIHDGDKSSYLKRSLEAKNAAKDSRSSEISKKISSDGGANKDDTKDTGEDSLKDSTTHYTAFEEEFESSEVDGVKSRNVSGFVQEDSKIYSHVGGENWTKTGDDKVDRVFTEIDNLSGNKFNDPSKLRRKRHTINTPEDKNYGHALEDQHSNKEFGQGLLKRNNVHENYGAQDNINGENHHYLGLQHGNDNGDHHINYGFEQGHLLQNNEQHRSSANEFYGAQENINRESHQHLGLQHGNENGDHNINYGFEQSNRLQNNKQHRLSANELYGAQDNNNGGNHHYLGLQHGNENGEYHINYGSEQGHLIQNNENHRSVSNEHNEAQENINRRKHQPLRLLYGHENSKIRNIHQGGEVNNFYGHEHHVNHGNYEFEGGLQHSSSSNNHENESNQGSNNLKLRNYHHHSVGSENENYGYENHRSEAINYPQNLAVNLRHSENANEHNGNRNYGNMANFHSVNSRNENQNGDYERRNGNDYLTIPGKGNYRSSNDRRRNQYTLSLGSNRFNRQSQILKPYRSSENGNLLSRGRSYRLGNQNYESVNLNSNSAIINNARNYLYSRRNYGSLNSGLNNRFNVNNAYTGISHLGRVENGKQLFQPAGYSQGVKHEDVRRFLRNNGRHIFSDHQRFNSDNHIRYFEPFNAGYHPINNGYTRSRGAYNKRIVKQGAIDLHHFTDNTHYSTGNGRYVFVPGNSGNNHRYYDTLTGLHYHIRKIPLHGGKNVIVPGNHVVHPGTNEQPRVEHGNSGIGLDLGSDIFYIGEGKYRHKDQIILAANIEIYLKGLGISGIPLTTDGLPLGLCGGYFPIDLGFGLTYQGDGTYKYQDNIIPHDQIIKFCKSKHITDISFTNDGFPENLFDGSLDSIFKYHLKLPIDLGNGLNFIGNGHYKWKDQIIPAIEIGEFIKEHNIDIEITKEGLPLTLFDATLAINVGSTGHGNDESKKDDLLNPHGLFPYDVGDSVLYDGKGNYIYKNITIPRTHIIEFCKSHDLTNISFTDDGFPASLFNDIEHGHIGPNWKNPIYLGNDLYYIDNGHYKYKNQIILASDIGEFIKTNKLNVHITKDGLPLGIYFGSLDHIYSPDEEDDVAHKSKPINYHEGYPLDLGSKLIYLGNGSYIYDEKEIISCKDIIEFSKSHSITNITFTNDGFPADLFINIEGSGSGSHGKLPIDLGDDLLYYESGHYSHKNKTIPIGEILEYIKVNKLNVSVTDYGLPSQLVAENFDSDFAPGDNEVLHAHVISLLDIYGDFPYDLESDIYYLGNGSYRCDNEIIDASEIIKYCKSHNIKDVVFTEDGFPASLFNKTISDKGSDRNFPIDLGNGLRFLGHGHYDYENKIYPASHIIDVVKNLNLNISLTDDGIPVELLDESEISNSGSTPVNLGKDDVEQIESSHEKEARECPKGPIDLGEGIVYIGDCHYMYLDHVIPAKYILGLLDILHIHDIKLPIGPDDDFVDKGEINDTDSKDDHTLDLGFDILCLGNGTYKYKNRYIPGKRYADFLKILGLKIQLSGDSEKLVEDSPKSDRSEEEILSLIDDLLKNDDIKTTEGHSTSTNDGNTSEDTKNQNDPSPGQQATNSKKPGKDDDNGSLLSDSGYSTTSSTTNSSSDVKKDSQPPAFDSNEHDLSSDDSTHDSTYTLSGSNSNNTSSVTSIDDTSEGFSSSTNSSDSSSNSDISYTSDKSSDISSSSNDTTTIYNSKRIDNSSGNSSTTENKDSSITNSSKSDKNSSSSDNSTVNSESFASNSTGTETRDSSNSSSGSYASFSSSKESDTISDSSSRNSSREYSDSSSGSSNSNSSSNDSETTSDSSSIDSSKTENQDSSITNAVDSSKSDESSSSSDNSTVNSESFASNSNGTETRDSSNSSSGSYASFSSSKESDTISDSCSRNSSREYSDSSSGSSNSKSSSNDSETTSDSSSIDSSKTENQDSSITNTVDSSKSDESSSSSDNSTVNSESFASNSTGTETRDSSNGSSVSYDSFSSSNESESTTDSSSRNSSSTEYSESSSSNDTTSTSNDRIKTSKGSVDNTSTTENSNLATNASQDSTSSDDNSSTTTNSSSDSSSVTSDSNSPTTTLPSDL